MGAVSYNLYLDTIVTPDSLRQWLVEEHGFELSTDWHTDDGVPVLLSRNRFVWVRPPDPDRSGPYYYKQKTTVFVTLNPNKERGGQAFLLSVVGDILQHCPGDATVEYDIGGAALLRRGATVWIEEDPFIREHLFTGDFRPAKLVIGLPPPDPDANAEQQGEDSAHG